MKFEFKINYTLNDYYKMNNISFSKDLKYNIIIYIILYTLSIFLCYFFLPILTTLGVIILLPILFYLINKINVKNNYNRIKLLGSIIFYDEYFELKSGDGYIKHEYSDIIETTKTYSGIYLILNNEQIFKLPIDEEFVEFIKVKVPYRRYY